VCRLWSRNHKNPRAWGGGQGPLGAIAPREKNSKNGIHRYKEMICWRLPYERNVEWSKQSLLLNEKHELMINADAVTRQFIYKRNRHSGILACVFMSHIKRDLSNNTFGKVKVQ